MLLFRALAEWGINNTAINLYLSTICKQFHMFVYVCTHEVCCLKFKCKSMLIIMEKQCYCQYDCHITSCFDAYFINFNIKHTKLAEWKLV